MSLFGIFKTKKTDKQYVVIDIGSESVGVAFVRSAPNAPLEVVDSIRHLIPFQEKINMKRYISLMQETVSITLDELAKKNSITPSRVLVNLASPWQSSQTRILNINENENFKITHEYLNDLIKKESSTFIKENESRNISKSPDAPKNIVIESHIIELKINGYHISNPIGRETNNLKLSLHVTSSSDQIVCSLKEMLEKKWRDVDIVFHSFMFSAFNAIRDNLSREKSFIIIDISGETTDISLIQDHVLSESISFPYGYRAIQRTATKDLSLESELAYSELKLFEAGKLNTERVEKINAILNKVTNNWIVLFRESLKQLVGNDLLPRDIYLITIEEYISYFRDAIIAKSGDILGEDQEKFNIIEINNELLSKYIQNKDNKCKDSFLCVTIILLEKLLDIENNYNYQNICQRIK